MEDGEGADDHWNKWRMKQNEEMNPRLELDEFEVSLDIVMCSGI